MSRIFTRRRLIAGGASVGGLALGGLALSSFDRITGAPSVQTLLGSATALTLASQRALLSGQPLAREYSPRDISPVFRPNGSIAPSNPDYLALAQGGFADWRLQVSGLVETPLALSLPELMALPSRTQITRHDCVEGWSAIGQWTGVPLLQILKMAGLKPQARFVVLRCFDDYTPSSDGSGRYYESIDLFDAFHPQTILAYKLNGQTLPVANGAPLRLRVERQLGYKQAKYLMGLEIVDSFSAYGRGKGGYWEDRGYQWYGGI